MTSQIGNYINIQEIDHVYRMLRIDIVNVDQI